jgi:hypothetical protein
MWYRYCFYTSMASNIDKVEDKAAGDLDKAIKANKTGSEIERKLLIPRCQL